MSWVDIEQAMQEAVAAASLLDRNNVVWSYQDKTERNMTFVRIHFGGEIEVSQDWLKNSTDLTRPAGQEVLQEVKGVREVPFDIEVFTLEVLGDSAARRIAERIRTRLKLESIRGRMRRAKVVPFSSGPVGYIPEVFGKNFRGRALVTLRCYVPVQDCLEYVGYIATANIRVSPAGWTGPSGATGFSVTATVG